MRCCHLPNYNAMSFERCKLFLLFQSLVEDILFGVTEWKVGKYKHSTKESVNDDRIKDSTKEGPYNARVNFINTHQQMLLRHLPPTHIHKEPRAALSLYRTYIRRLFCSSWTSSTSCYYARIMKTYQLATCGDRIVTVKKSGGEHIVTIKLKDSDTKYNRASVQGGLCHLSLCVSYDLYANSAMSRAGAWVHWPYSMYLLVGLLVYFTQPQG